MANIERVSMTPDGAVQWRRYREGRGVFTHPEGLPSDQVMRVHDLVLRPRGERVGEPSRAASILKYGNYALKCFNPFIHDDPSVNGRYENLRIGVSVAYALRDHPHVADSRWRLSGRIFHGAYIADEPSIMDRTTWAMEYIEGVTTRQQYDYLSSDLRRAIFLENIADTLEAAAEAAGESHLKVDAHHGNFLIPNSSLPAIHDADKDIELIAIDVGSKA